MSSKHPTKTIPTELIPGINRLKPTHDAEALRLKKIKSPELSKLKFHLTDPRTKCTWYFATQARKDKHIERMDELATAEPMNVKKAAREKQHKP